MHFIQAPCIKHFFLFWTNQHDCSYLTFDCMFGCLEKPHGNWRMIGMEHFHCQCILDCVLKCLYSFCIWFQYWNFCYLYLNVEIKMFHCLVYISVNKQLLRPEKCNSVLFFLHSVVSNKFVLSSKVVMLQCNWVTCQCSGHLALVGCKTICWYQPSVLL